MTSLNSMIIAFQNKDFNALRTIPGFNASSTELTYNNELVLKHTRNGLMLCNKNTSDLIVISVLNAIEGIKAHLSDTNNIIINHMLWDNKTVNISLFY